MRTQANLAIVGAGIAGCSAGEKSTRSILGSGPRQQWLIIPSSTRK